MEPVTLILTALAAGGKDAATAAVKDAYYGLKHLISRRFHGKPSAEIALAEHASDPATWHLPLVKALTDIQAGQDEQILAAARRLLEVTDPDGARAGKYTLIDARGAHHAQFGDHNRQINLDSGGTYVEGNQTPPKP